MTSSGLFYDRYTVDADEEWLLRIGPVDAPALLFLPPLFEELNRTRALLTSTMRALAERGWKCLLPDLPGTGESRRALDTVTWQDFQSAIGAAAPPEIAGIVSVRGGCLFDLEVASPCIWRLSPIDGAALVRDLERAALAGDGANGGYEPGKGLIAALARATPGIGARIRTARMASDPAAADLKFDSPPVWRRAEPQTSSELSAAIASDIDDWVRSCAAC